MIANLMKKGSETGLRGLKDLLERPVASTLS